MATLVPHGKQVSALVVGGMCAVAAFVLLAGTSVPASAPLRSSQAADAGAVGPAPAAAHCPAGTRETADACVRVVHRVLPASRPAVAPAVAVQAAGQVRPVRRTPATRRPAVRLRQRVVAPPPAPVRTAEPQEQEHEDGPEPAEHEDAEHD